MTGRLRRALTADDGRIALLVVIMAFGVLAMIGLAVDGGGKMRSLQRADNIAAEAARTAGQAIDLDQAATGGAKVVDPVKGIADARRYLTAAGVTGTVSLSGDRRRIDVSVTIHYDTKILGMLGYGQLTVTGTSSALLISR